MNVSKCMPAKGMNMTLSFSSILPLVKNQLRNLRLLLQTLVMSEIFLLTAGNKIITKECHLHV